MTDTEIDEKAADIEATYLVLCQFCCEMRFRPTSLTGAMAIMLFELAAARGLANEAGITEIRSLWNKMIEASAMIDAAEAIH